MLFRFMSPSDDAAVYPSSHLIGTRRIISFLISDVRARSAEPSDGGDIVSPGVVDQNYVA